MTEKQVPYTDLSKLLGRFRERGEVRAPAKDETGEVVLTEPNPEPVMLDYGNFRLSPKEFLLPRSQTLLCFKDGKAEEPALPDRQTILFGVRPCDARALLALDQVFLNSDQQDPYYAHLRAKTVLVALACTRPMSSCFCTSVGGGPGSAEGADVFAVRLETGLLLKAQTPRGEDLLSSVSDLLTEAAPRAVTEAEKRIRAAEGQLAPVEADDGPQRLRDGYESPIWETISQKCLGCGTCSFLCPTCYCFDITDEVRGGTGRRVRTWDCCAYPLFTMQASGHNPRPTPKERCRQRIMHKFRYAVENFDRPFCVGCGRCICNCPVSIDLRTVLKEVGA